MQGYEADKFKKVNRMEKKKRKDAHAPLRLIQVEIGGQRADGEEQRLRETVFRTHLVWPQTTPV